VTITTNSFKKQFIGLLNICSQNDKLKFEQYLFTFKAILICYCWFYTASQNSKNLINTIFEKKTDLKESLLTGVQNFAVEHVFLLHF